jgi:hypothetical protein
VPFEGHRRNIIHSYIEERRGGDKSTKGIKERENIRKQYRHERNDPTFKFRGLFLTKT